MIKCVKWSRARRDRLSDFDIANALIIAIRQYNAFYIPNQ